MNIELAQKAFQDLDVSLSFNHQGLPDAHPLTAAGIHALFKHLRHNNLLHFSLVLRHNVIKALRP